MSVSPQDIGIRAAVHLLNRLGFGPRPGDAHLILEKGLDRWVREQLEPGPDPELDARLSRFATLGYPLSQTLALDYGSDPRAFGQVLDEFVAAKVIRAVHGRNQLQEVLVDFWFNHFNVYIADGFVRPATPSYERDAIRPHVLGRFRDLLGATAQHPAMLSYLDNYLNTVARSVGGRVVGGINENYGRELMELHTVGVDAGYTQADVVDAARCFTGWGIDSLRAGGNFVFRPGGHDPGAKSVFGLTLAAGGARDDGDRLLDHLARHPATARHVSRRLAERLVADAPPDGLVDRAAQTFLATQGDIAEVVKTIVGSPEFWVEAFAPTKSKTPFEFVLSALRAADAEVASARGVSAALQAMGMPLYASVPPTGYSNRGNDWVNPSSHLARINFGLDLAAGAVAGVTVDARGAVRQAGGNAEDAHNAAAALSADLFGRGLSADTVGALSRVAPAGSPSVAARVLGLTLASPEMQVR
ncbi:MAG: DUF1800 domain-containing protein [Acidobacteria bacterium]|nr:MAG: DUF1800 domain-containing protein [Acidobacteriota bacterium]